MNVRRCVYNMVYSNEKTTISSELFNKIMQCYMIECYMAIKKDGIVLFININVHIRICMKRTCCKTVCTLQYDLISSICLNSYSCIYRPEYQWAGVSGCWHYRCYLSFSFLIFFEILYWACVIFIIGKKALNLFPPSLSSYFLVIKWGWHVLLWCRTFWTQGSVLCGGSVFLSFPQCFPEAPCHSSGFEVSASRVLFLTLKLLQRSRCTHCCCCYWALGGAHEPWMRWTAEPTLLDVSFLM